MRIFTLRNSREPTAQYYDHPTIFLTLSTVVRSALREISGVIGKNKAEEEFIRQVLLMAKIIIGRCFRYITIIKRQVTMYL